MGRLDGKVAFITGAARGQGRSHALTLAAEGAAIIAVDLCQQIDSVQYPMSTPADLSETAELVRRAGGRILTREADVRNFTSLEVAVSDGVDEFGRLDIVIVNAGILNGFGNAWEIEEDQLNEQWEVNAAGAWRTVKATVPQLLKQGDGGSIVFASSVVGLVGEANIVHYAMAKHAVQGLMHNLSLELAPYMIRVNCVCPTTVDTPMVNNPQVCGLFAGKAEATWEEATPAMRTISAMPVPFLDPLDVSNAVLYLVSDDGRFVTGTSHVIDAGALIPFKAPQLGS